MLPVFIFAFLRVFDFRINVFFLRSTDLIAVFSALGGENRIDTAPMNAKNDFIGGFSVLHSL